MFFDTRVDNRPVNTLQIMLDNSQLGESVCVYENGDQQFCSLPKKLLNEDGSVKVKNGLMLFHVGENKVIAKNPQQVYDLCDDYLIFEEGLNCCSEQLQQVFEWFKQYGVCEFRGTNTW